MTTNNNFFNNFSLPQWVVYDQLLQTSQDFILGVTVVDDDWLTGLSVEQCGFDLDKVLSELYEREVTTRACIYGDTVSVLFKIKGKQLGLLLEYFRAKKH
jgi:hypothetical protein